MGDGEKVCVVTGVGPGTGAAIARRFASAGYRVAMLARNAERLAELADTVPGTRPFVCDVADEAETASTTARIEQELGPVHTLVHNAVSATIKNFLEVDPADFRHNFEVNTVALLRLAQLTAPGMMARGEGVILATGNTSAYRGKANFAGFAPTKAAQRILIESIARHAGPQGVHAAYVAIDAVIDLPWTRKVFEGRPDDFFCKPDDIAETCLQVARQPKSAWCSDIVIRPFGEQW